LKFALQVAGRQLEGQKLNQVPNDIGPW